MIFSTKSVYVLSAFLLLSACSDNCVPDFEGACTERLSCRQINEQTAISHGLHEQSVRELLVCGQIQQELMTSLTYVLIDSLLTDFPISIPDQVEHVQGGIFQILSNSGTSSLSMTVEFLSADQFSFGATGTVLPANPFQRDSYFGDSKAVFDSQNSIATLTFSEPGPLVELLGFTTDVTSPQIIDRDKLRTAAVTILRTKVRSTIEISDQILVGEPPPVVRSGDKVGIQPQQEPIPIVERLAEFEYVVTAPSISVAVAFGEILSYIEQFANDKTFSDAISGLVNSQPVIPFYVNQLTGTRRDIQQTAALSSWNVDYDLENQGLTGDFSTGFQSPLLNYDAKFLYSSSATANIQFSCTQ